MSTDSEPSECDNTVVEEDCENGNKKYSNFNISYKHNSYYIN